MQFPFYANYTSQNYLGVWYLQYFKICITIISGSLHSQSFPIIFWNLEKRDSEEIIWSPYLSKYTWNSNTSIPYGSYLPKDYLFEYSSASSFVVLLQAVFLGRDPCVFFCSLVKTLVEMFLVTMCLSFSPSPLAIFCVNLLLVLWTILQARQYLHHARACDSWILFFFVNTLQFRWLCHNQRL